MVERVLVGALSSTMVVLVEEARLRLDIQLPIGKYAECARLCVCVYTQICCV